MKKVLLLAVALSYGFAYGQSTLGGGVVFSEIMPDPTGDPGFDTNGDGSAIAQDEFIEIYNLSATDIDISDWELWDAGTDEYFTFPSSTTLKAGAYAVVVLGIGSSGSVPTVTGNNLSFSAGRGSGVMNNAMDNIVLYDPNADEYIQAKYNGDSDDDPTDDTDSNYSGFSTTATRSGSIEDFGNETGGNSIVRTPVGGTSFDLNTNACSCSDLASPGFSTIITWDGSESSDWSDGDNWDGGVVPGNTDNVAIANAGTAPVIASGTEAACKNLTINSSASLNVSSGGSLAIYGTATNSGTYTVEKAVTGNAGYSILGAPVGDAFIGDMSLADHLAAYDNTTDTWTTPTGTDAMPAGFGFFVGHDESSPTVSFSGAPNTGDITYSVTETSGFELIANPYAAAIDVEDFLADNSIITGGVYLWDDGGSNVSDDRGGDYISVTAMGAASSVEPGGTSDGVAGNSGATPADDGYIASVQGFFVELSGSGDITFSPDHQVFADGSNDESDHYRKVAYQKVKLAIEGNGLYNEVLVGLGEGATYGVDRTLDARKFITDNPLSFYSLLDGEKYVIQGLPLARVEDVNTKLGFDMAEAGNYDLKVVSFENIPSDLLVSIIDHQTNEVYTLKENTEIPFYTGVVEGDDRFELIFSNSQVLSELEPLSSIDVYGTASELSIQANVDGKQQVVIYSIDGRVSFREEATFVNRKALITPLLNPDQVYILRVNSESVKFNIN